MSREYTPPSYKSERFHCPFPQCGAFAHMSWRFQPNDVAVAECVSCHSHSIWRRYVGGFDELDQAIVHGTMLYPITSMAPPHHPDLPEHICPDYEEARLICTQSPRAAAALLRLCVQKICNHLLGKEGEINKQIGELVQKGLPVRAQQALDAVRVIGNESVHPGTIDLNDTPELALALFRLINLIVQNCITDPREAAEIFSSLPPGKLKGIEDRDKPKA